MAQVCLEARKMKLISKFSVELMILNIIVSGAYHTYGERNIKPHARWSAT
jgi:hypothetical protein